MSSNDNNTKNNTVGHGMGIGMGIGIGIGQPSTAIEIPCCLCGTLILPNAANQCGACLAQQFDLKVSDFEIS